MAEAIPPTFWGPEAEEAEEAEVEEVVEVEEAVLLTWAGCAVEVEVEEEEVVVAVVVVVVVAAAPVLELVVLVQGGPEELLEELLGVWDEAGGAGVRWDNSEPSRD